MDKRTFIKTSSAIAGGALFSRFAGCATKTDKGAFKKLGG